MTIEHFVPAACQAVAVTDRGICHPIVGFLGIVETRTVDPKDEYDYPPQWAPRHPDNQPRLVYVAATMTREGEVRPARDIPGFSYIKPVDA